jgi:cyclophilin family peptidyl-prolyl cis-trans isomerase
MLKVILICMTLLLALGVPSGVTADKLPVVRLETSQGDIAIQLYPQKAPETVKNFLRYVRSGYYENTVFHRVIKDFMIQGGGLTADMRKKPTQPPIPNEASNRLPNRRGSIAMARTADPHSATSQFFINTVDNKFLNYRASTGQGWGYCVFGQVVQGMEVVDRIAAAPTVTRSGRQNVPRQPIIIKRAIVLHQP